MSTLNNSSPATKAESIPFWRDGRIIGILLQIIFVILLVRSGLWLVGNIAENLDALGPGQFICRDGSSSFRCAFDFLSADAQFDIQESVIDYTPADSYWRAIAVGMLNTAKVSIIGIVLTTILGTVTGIARLSENWLVRNIAKWYIDLMRNTPLLLQLFFLYFVIFLGLAGVNEAIQPLNLPIYISQRGVNYPSFVRMTSFGIWFAFIILGIIQGQVLWIILGRREELTGHSTNRLRWVVISFILVAGIGWVVASNDKNEAMLVSRAARVREFDDLSGLLVRRLPITDLVDLDTALESGALSQEDLDAAALQICAIKDSPSEVNLTMRLRQAGIPYEVTRVDRPDQAIESYADGSCEIFVASRSILAGERELLEDGNAHLIVPLSETPMRLSSPRLEGFNFVGGGKMSTEFTALLIGLVLFTAAFVAEIVRAGIQSVSKGQTEAARALGLSESQRLQLVVLPQALRVIIPPLTSQYLNLTKNSSLALAVAFPDLYRTIDTMINQSGRSLQLVVIMAAIYLSISLIISAFLNWYNKRIALVER